MATELPFTCGLKHGLHARPASQLADALAPLEAHVELNHIATGKSADVRSVLSVVALDVAFGDNCVFRARGKDADAAIAALREAVDAMAHEDEHAGSEVDTDSTNIPAGLRRLNTKWVAGQSISPGTARGPALLVRSQRFTMENQEAGDPAAERGEVDRALAEVRESLSGRLRSAQSDLERDLLRAHISIAGDPALHTAINDAIDNGQSAASAIHTAGDTFVRALKASASEYIRERAIDVTDVYEQLLERLDPANANNSCIELERASIVVAEVLTPRQMMQLDRTLTQALVLGSVGATSHTAILARAMGIPTIVDVHDLELHFCDGCEVIVDADAGYVLHELTPDVVRYYEIGERSAKLRQARLLPFAEKEARTRCGARLEISANVASADEVTVARMHGAEGVGLFRTEMLFLDRLAPPNEEEQFRTYKAALEHAAGTTVIFRTLDIGGDKPAPYLRLQAEENPFLGYRGIRLYPKYISLLHSQLRALVRASAHGSVKIMAPMVTHAGEAKWFRERVREVQDELRREGHALDDAMPIGVMIEVPSAAMAIPQLADHADFFSIGTNDLSQYFHAADRGNARVALLCDPFEPAFLRLLDMIVREAKAQQRWVGVCGEMAGEELALPIMVGLGLDEISVSSARVLELKSRLAALEGDDCGETFTRALTMRDAGEVRAALRTSRSRIAVPIIEPELVVVGSDARTKVEAIKELVGLIAAAGRAEDVLALENAVWDREDTYSTGLGHGFAIPHCKSDAVREPTIAVLRLSERLEWGSADGEPVVVAIMLAIPGENEASARTHMQVLARLARQLMHAEFRAAIMDANSPDAVVEALTNGLQM